MPLVAKDTGGGSDFTPVPEGTHLAVCNMVVDLGLQETTYQGEPKIKHQCFIRWELPNERIEYNDKQGQRQNGPMSIGKTYTLSLGEKANLRKDLEAWRGRAFTKEELAGFDLFKLAGVPCQVSVVHEEKNGKVYANIRGVAGWPKGMPKPDKTESDILKYSPDESERYNDLPQWLRDKLEKQIDQGSPPDDPRPTNGHADLDDPIPF